MGNPPPPGTFFAPLALDFFRRRWTRGSLKSGKPSWWKVKKDTTPTKQGLKAAWWMFFGWMGYYISWIFFWMGKAGWFLFFCVVGWWYFFFASVSWVEALRYEPWGLWTLVWVKYEIVQWQKKNITNNHKSANQRSSINIQNRFWCMNAPKFWWLKEMLPTSSPFDGMLFWIFIVWDRGLFGKSWQNFKRHQRLSLLLQKN